MNVIYRRLWSTARKCWVVASEIAVVRGRASHTLGVVTMTGLLAAMPALHAAETEDEEERQLQLRDLRRVAEPQALPSLFSSALAATSAPAATYRQLAVVTDYHYVDASVSGEEQLVLGSRTGIHGSKSVVYGNVAYANGTHNTALGYSSKAYGGYATAVGAVAIADGIGTIALGNYANAYDENSIAIGSGSLTVKGAGISRIAIGGNARAGTNGWTGAIALGGESQADHDAVAVGYGAKATRDGALAIGRGAAATEAGALALGKDSVASESYTVSVGNASRKRRIVNVEDARLSTTSTDAVTGKQLHSTNQSVATATSTATAAKTAADQALINSRIVTQTSTFGEIRVGGENTGSTLSINNKSGAARYLNGVRNGALNTTSTDAVTGQQLYATNQNVLAARVVADAAAGRMSSANVALGQSAVAEGAAGTASASLGAAARAYNTQSVALGADARAAVDASGSKSEAIGAVALGAASRSGNGAVASGLRAIATGDRAVAIGNDASARFTHATAVGYRAAAGANQATAVGREASASGTYASAVGNLAKATADSAVALGDRASASHAGSIALGNGSQTTAANQVSVGSASLKRRIVNVADAILSAGSTDAVTGSQLHTTNANVASARGAAEAAQRTADAVKLSAEEALTRTDALGGLIGQVAGNGNLRLGAENTGNVLDVRNKAGAGRKVTGLIDGVLRTDSTDAVNGKQLHATNGGVAAAQSSADSALGKVGILEGLLGQVAADGTLRLGAQNTGATLDMRNGNNGTRRLTGLSDGALGGSSTEAVTGRQLHATNQLVDIQGQALLVHGQTLAAHGQQMVLQDGRIAENRTDLDALRLAFEDFDPDLEGVVRFSEDGSVDLGGGKVRGLARGDISSASSMEAVNGGQLFETNARLAAVEGAGKFVSVGGGGDQSGSMAGLGAVAIGDSARASVDAEGAVALGAYAAALAKNSVSLGRAAHVTADATDGFALGVGTAVRQAGGVALGAESVVNDTAVSSLALGYGSQATESHTASFGNDGVRRRLVNVARGTAAFDVVTVAQLGEAIDVLGGGAGLDARGQVTAPSYDIQGSVRHNVGEALSALDSATTTVTAQVSNMEIQLRSIFSDVPTARSDGTPQLTLAGANGMVLSNVANGLIAAGSRDAVNGGQLHAVQQQLNGRMDGLEQRVDGQPQASAPLAAHRMAATDEAGAEEAAPSSPLQVAGTTDAPTPQSPAAPAPRADAPEDVKPQVDTADLERMLARANDYADGISREVDARLNKMDKRFNRMAAMSSAQSAMAMNTAGLATYNRLGAGVGYSDGESAMAVGYQRVLNEKGSATFSLNGAFTNSGERSVGVGVGIGW